MAFLIGLVLGTQSTGIPELPPPLIEDPQVVAAWEVERHSPDAEVQRAAAALILERLPAAAPADQFDFLLGCAGGDLLNADLGPALRRVDRAWEGSRARLGAVLALPPDEEMAMVRGGLRAAGHLEASDPALVEAIASLLSAPELQSDARASLLTITGREFADWESFRSWWEEAHDQSRETWLSRSLREMRQRELVQWRDRLQRSPAAALEAAGSERAEVRRLAYAAIPELQNAGGEPAREAVQERLRQCFREERIPQLRHAVIGLLPLFFEGEAAVEMLNQALDARNEQERVQAARQLQLVRPPEAAIAVVEQRLAHAYPEDGQPLEGSVALRQALWSGLRVLADEAELGAERLAALQPLLINAVAREPAAPVRARIFTASGELAGPDLMHLLRDRAMDAAGDTTDRAASLKAYTRVAVRLQEGLLGLEGMQALLADADEAVRSQAIASLQALGGVEDLGGAPVDELLAARLNVEQQAAILRRLLRALAGGPDGDGAVLATLLEYEPPEGMAEEYRKAVRAHVDGDFAALQQSVEVLSARRAWESGYRLVAGFDRASLAEGQVAQLDRLHARTLSEWLIEAGVENGNANLALDAVGRLAELAEREADQRQWPRLLTELQLMRGKEIDALAAFERLLGLEDLAPELRWGLGLRCVNAALAKDLVEEGRALFAALGEPPDPYREFYRSTAERLPAPPGPGPAPEEEPGDGAELPEGGEVAEDDGGATGEPGAGEPDAGGGGGDGSGPRMLHAPGRVAPVSVPLPGLPG